MTALILHGATSPLSTVASAQQFDTLTTRQSLVHCHFPMMTSGKMNPFPIPLAQSFWDRGQLFMATLGTWDRSSGVAWTWPDLTTGRYDAGLIQVATAIAAWKHPLFIRLDHEMQGSWAPWFTDGPTFVKIWQYIVACFRTLGATNVTWVWCPNQIDPSLGDGIAAWYPGDDYCDWVGFDAYNPASARGDSWHSWAEISDLSYATIAKLAPTKPMLIGEFGSHNAPGNKAQWLTDCLSYIAVQQPAIRAISYYQKVGDVSVAHPIPAQWPLLAPDGTAAAYTAALKAGPYAQSFPMPPDLQPILPLQSATWGDPTAVMAALLRASESLVSASNASLAEAITRASEDAATIQDYQRQLEANAQAALTLQNRADSAEAKIAAWQRANTDMMNAETGA